MEEQKEFDAMLVEIEKDSQERYRKSLQIINCLNELEEIISKEYCSLILLTEKDKFIINTLIKNKIEYIKDSLLNEKKCIGKNMCKSI